MLDCNIYIYIYIERELLLLLYNRLHQIAHKQNSKLLAACCVVCIHPSKQLPPFPPLPRAGAPLTLQSVGGSQPSTAVRCTAVSKCRVLGKWSNKAQAATRCVLDNFSKSRANARGLHEMYMMFLYRRKCRIVGSSRPARGGSTKQVLKS